MTSISNLKLRSVKSSDFKIYYRLVSNEKVAHGAKFKPAQTLSRARQLFNEDLKGAKCLAITIDGQMAGMISLYPTIGANSAPNYQSLEIADMLLPEYQNHHYMTEAIGALVRRLRRGRRVKKLLALVDENNVASQKVLQNNQFVNYRSILDFTTGHENLVYQLNVK